MSNKTFSIIPELNKISKILAGYLLRILISSYLVTNQEISYIFEYFTVLDTVYNYFYDIL